MTDPGTASSGPLHPVEGANTVEGVGRGLALTPNVLELITRLIILEAFQESLAS